jgi:hypothetical protein
LAFDGVASDGVAERAGVGHTPVIPSLIAKSRPVSRSTKSSASETPVILNPNPVEAKASAWPDTSSALYLPGIC